MIGTVGMIKRKPEIFELVKLAVTPKYKGQHVSRKLMEKCIAFAQENKAQKIILYTNHKLAPAIGLYPKYGFQNIVLTETK